MQNLLINSCRSNTHITYPCLCVCVCASTSPSGHTTIIFALLVLSASRVAIERPILVEFHVAHDSRFAHLTQSEAMQSLKDMKLLASRSCVSTMMLASKSPSLMATRTLQPGPPKTPPPTHAVLWGWPHCICVMICSYFILIKLY